ncbi:MAG: L,D-transpeptidase [Butyrivibrio sp.]|jgi:hypothetical protein|uniref:L,D-transpeptidase n=1 Tax=Butyrivibrio sp. TaxID=28121 RepID=UPI001EBE8AE8|nr:L,D-transpeptidase [Butyrivibrio sp.]MBE5840218.1 L,D-transpeptidase [Butyrivibrio sp.]
MKSILKGVCIGLFIVTILTAGIYILLGFYYMEGFPCFTWINGVYCTGKNVEEVNRELCRKYRYDGITVVDKNGTTLFVSSDEVNYQIDFTDSLNEFLDKKNPFAWGYYFFHNPVASFEPKVSLDSSLLSGKIADWEIFMPDSELDVTFMRTDDGYILQNDLEAVPQIEEIIESVYLSMLGREDEVHLYDIEGCYKSHRLNEEQQRIYDLYMKIDALCNCGRTYDVEGENFEVTKAVVADWIVTDETYEEASLEKESKKDPGKGLFIINGVESSFPKEVNFENGIALDENGDVILSESKMYSYLKSISMDHGTAYYMDKYRNGESNKIYIKDNSKGDGLLFEIQGEFDSLISAYLQGNFNEESTVSLAPSDSVIEYDASELLGKTYIEVNMGEQHLYYYVNGELSMDMPIVTGNVNRSRGTPTGIYNVYNKRYHTNLVGVDYVSYVNYWLGVHKGVGIHDATWRSKFGDEIYKRDGSHGCINCPLDSVEKLWEVVEVGTPVVLYY